LLVAQVELLGDRFQASGAGTLAARAASVAVLAKALLLGGQGSKCYQHQYGCH
jgi:hypothetical protein